MSKRIISFLLCALLALSAAGCGKDKPVSGNKKPGNTSSVGFTYVVLTLSDRPSHAVRLTD